MPSSRLFDGATGNINVGSASNLDDQEPFSITAWIYPHGEGENNQGAIFRKDTNWGLQMIATDTIRFFKEGSTFLILDGNNSTITNNAWNYVCATWDGSATATNAHLYVDGSEITYATTQNGVSLTSDNTLDLFIGNRTDDTRTFDGEIAHVNFYGKVLSANEMEELRWKPETDMGSRLGYWPLMGEST